MELGIVRRLFSNTEPEILDINTFLERYTAKYGRAKLSRLTIYTFWDKALVVGIVNYELPVSPKSLSDANVRASFPIYKEHLNPNVVRHLSLDSPIGLRVFRRYSTGADGFFTVSEYIRRISRLHDNEIELCFPRIYQLLQEKSKST